MQVGLPLQLYTISLRRYHPRYWILLVMRPTCIFATTVVYELLRHEKTPVILGIFSGLMVHDGAQRLLVPVQFVLCLTFRNMLVTRLN